MDVLVKEISQTYIFPSVIFLVMFGLGSALNLDALKKTLMKPWPLTVGLFGQLILLPALAFLVALNGSWPAYVALSFIIIAVCPGGSTSNAIVFALGGVLALSVSLTAIASILTLFTIPLYLELGFQLLGNEGFEVALPMANILRNLVLMTVLPIGLGIALQKMSPGAAEKLVVPMRKLSLILILMIIALSMYNARGYLDEDFGTVVFASFLLAFMVIAGGFFLAKMTGLSIAQQLTIAIEVGIQNTALAIYIGASLLGRSELVIVAVTYGIINYALIGLIVFAFKRAKVEIGG